MNKKRYIIGGTVTLLAAAGLYLHSCNNPTPIVYSPRIYNQKGCEVNIKKPLIPGKYSVVPGKGKQVHRVTIDVKGDGKLPTDKTLTFIVRNGQKLELDTIGYTKKGERAASEKILMYGKKAEKKPKKSKIKKLKIIKHSPKKIGKPNQLEQILEKLRQLEQKLFEKPKSFDLGQDNGSVYKIRLPDKNGWFLNFCSTLAHSNDGKEAVVEFMYPIDQIKGEKVEKSYLIAADVPKKFFWDHKKPNVRLNTRSEVNKFVKALLNKGYVIKGQNKDGLFLFDKRTAEEYKVKVDLNRFKGGWQRRLCDVVSWQEDYIKPVPY